MKAIASQQAGVYSSGSSLPSFISVAQAAQALSVSRPTIYGLFRDGVLRKIKLNQKTIRIPIEDVQKLLLGREI